ncbi:MAG: hypothetical protein O8C67_06895 [Candidatus Methanoperedens sp.]|nr:hypothetical protein [Candidatus Methanoperedens sp.]
MAGIKQENVIERIKEFFGKNNCPLPQKSPSDNRRPDLILKKDGLTYYIEAIAFNENKGKNQSDFWKAFAQAISRLNRDSIWESNREKPDKIVIALPEEFKRGWKSRVNIHGKDVWCRIGNAFPELEIWFVKTDKPDKPDIHSWNDAFSVVNS